MESEQKKDKKWRWVVIRKCPVFLAGFVFAILCFIGLNAAMEPASKPQFCGGQCHEMKDAYRSWELSVHGANKYGIQVGCVDCHLPSKEDQYFAHVSTKAYEGGKDFFKHTFIGDFDSEKARARAREHMPDKRCMHCHDSLLVKPGSSAARTAHMDVLNQPEESRTKCIECHEGIGHQRQKKIYSP